jgi:hypothetical protein
VRRGGHTSRFAARTRDVEKVNRVVAGAGRHVRAVHWRARRGGVRWRSRRAGGVPAQQRRARRRLTRELALPQRLRDVVQQPDAVRDLHLARARAAVGSLPSVGRAHGTPGACSELRRRAPGR